MQLPGPLEEHHPLLGRVHRVGDTVMTAIDWERPTEIPAILDPAKLPPGFGGALMNELAHRARAAGVPALRYAGPYPTSALYRTLLRSFRTTATEDAFTHDAMDRALRVARDPIPIDFVPAPHERIAHPRGHAEVRDGVEAVVVDGLRFERGDAPHRIVDDRAELWIGGAPYATAARVAPDGGLVAYPDVPRCESPVIGQSFPPPLVAALAEIVADLVTPPLAADAKSFLAAHPVVWADLGLSLARFVDDGFVIHASLWDRLAVHGLPRVALALAESLAPVVARAIVGVMSKP